MRTCVLRSSCSPCRHGSALAKPSAQSAHAAAPAELASLRPSIPAVPQADSEPAKKTRFVIALERRVDYQVISLPNPNRVIVDLPNVKLRLPPSLERRARSASSAASAPASARRENARRHRRDGTVVVEKSEFLGGRRRPRAADAGDRTGRPDMASLVQAAVASSPTSQPPPGVQRALRKIQPPVPRPAERPGKRAANDLQAAHRPRSRPWRPRFRAPSGTARSRKTSSSPLRKTLRDQLRASGHYRVAMTREDDTFVPLDERRAFAEERKAALFIAIHADYATSRARGATIYSLRDSVATNLAASARRESPSRRLVEPGTRPPEVARPAGPDGQGILADLATRETQTTATARAYSSAP